jgi:hypothetical protein
MLFDYVVGLLKKNQKVTTGAPTEDAARDGMARSITQALRAVGQDALAGTDDEESPNLAVATDWMMTAMDHFDRLPVTTEPEASFPTDLVAAELPALCACSVATETAIAH